MLNTLGRNLNFCFTKIKPPSSAESPPSIPQDHSRPSSAPKSTSFFFIRNFNSLFDQSTTSAATAAADSDSDSDSDSAAATPDFATAVASRRFFFSSPGRSNSIIDSSSLSSSPSSSASSPVAGAPPHTADEVGGGVAVPTYSPDPYGDFRRSMAEMVEARGLHDVRESWEQLHELLTCYLSLNPKCTHKIIFAAFADLLVSLMSNVN